MKTQEMKVGKVTVLVATTSATKTGGIKETSSLKKKSENISEVISEMAGDLGAKLKSVASTLAPDEVELEFKLGLTEDAKYWLINVGGEQSVSVKMTWKSEKKEIASK